MPLDIGVLILGIVRLPASLDLGIIGMPGCPLRISPDVTLKLVGAGNTASLLFPVPNDPTLIGFQLFTQALSLDLGLNPFGFSISDAAVMLVGPSSGCPAEAPAGEWRSSCTGITRNDQLRCRVLDVGRWIGTAATNCSSHVRSTADGPSLADSHPRVTHQRIPCAHSPGLS